MIDHDRPEPSVRRQCELLRVCRSGLYYTPRPRSPEELALMRSEGILRVARGMLHWYRAQRPGQSLADLSGKDVLAFVAHLAAACVADTTRSGAVSAVRSWLRYLHGRGIVGEDLARLVPRVPQWRMARVPGHLAWAEVRAVIDAIDPAEPTGKRDRALLLPGLTLHTLLGLLASTGLRSGEALRR
jgi:integrase/recombinase XerD